MKCEEPVNVRCKCCGGVKQSKCGKPALYGVFYDGDGPVGYCRHHRLAMGEGWLSGRILASRIRKHRGTWQVNVRGKWMVEDSPEYIDLRLKQFPSLSGDDAVRVLINS